MQSFLQLLLLAQAAAVSPNTVDLQRLNAELAADADVLRSLRSNGDVPSMIRPIDVRFVGPTDNVRLLEQKNGSLGWRVVQRVPLDDGSEALDVQRDQATDTIAIRRLTEAALQIEAQFSVHYDGWGTVSTKP